MYNIYFKQNYSKGADKVVTNLLFGLNNLGIKYQCNTGFDKVLCLQNIPEILEKANNNMLVGTNICVLPVDNGYIMNQKYKYCLVPCEWVKYKYSKWIDINKIKVWPVGIDTDKWQPQIKQKKYDCLVYYKNRTEKELEIVIELLKSNNQSYFVLTYGNYKEDFFYNLINECKYGILLDNTESQGIAIMEMLSCNLTLFVWNMTKWDHRKGYEFPATSVPYFNNKCGCVINESNNMNECFDEFMHSLNMYEPRKYITDNFTVEKQAKELIDLFKV